MNIGGFTNYMVDRQTTADQLQETINNLSPDSKLEVSSRMVTPTDVVTFMIDEDNDLFIAMHDAQSHYGGLFNLDNALELRDLLDAAIARIRERMAGE